jgi:amino acid transporter
MAIDPAATAHTHAHTHTQQAYVDWPAVFAGALVASAIFWVLNTFGSAIGLALSSPYPADRPPPRSFLIGAGLWLVWVTVSAHMAGGYIAGRMRRRANDASEHESNVRDGVHGLTVWAIGVLIGAIVIALAATGGTTVGVNTGAAQQATQAAADAARKAGAFGAFVTAASLFVAAAGAAWAATMGGNHRDQNTDTSWWWWRRI